MRSCVIVLIVFLSTCFTVGEEDKPELPVLGVPYCELAKNPSAWVGKRIRVRAIYSFGFEIQRLKSPVCCHEKELGIWVEPGSDLDRRSLRIFRKFGKMGMGWALAVFVGRFEGGNAYGAMGERFRLTVDNIEEVEKTARARDPVVPDWVPRDCPASLSSS